MSDDRPPHPNPPQEDLEIDVAEAADLEPPSCDACAHREVCKVRAEYGQLVGEEQGEVPDALPDPDDLAVICPSFSRR